VAAEEASKRGVSKATRRVPVTSLEIGGRQPCLVPASSLDFGASQAPGRFPVSSLEVGASRTAPPGRSLEGGGLPARPAEAAAARGISIWSPGTPCRCSFKFISLACRRNWSMVSLLQQSDEQTVEMLVPMMPEKIGFGSPCLPAPADLLHGLLKAAPRRILDTKPTL